MANGLRARFGPPDRIRYLLFGGAREPLTIHIPVTLSRGYLNLLQFMPKAVPQFLDPIEWHKKAQMVHCFRHYDFGVVYDDAPKEYIADEIDSKRLTVILLHSRLPALWDVVREHRSKCLVLSIDKQLGADFSANETLREIYCADLDELFAKLTLRIAHLLNFKMNDVEQSIKNRVAELKEHLQQINDDAQADFRACEPNDHTFLQLLAPYGQEVLKLGKVEHSKRPAALIKSAERVLNAYAVITARSTGTDRDWPDYQPPLVLTWPYYGPNHKALFKSLIDSQTGKLRESLKVIGKVTLGEQDPGTYEYHIDSSLLKDEQAVMTAISEFQVKMVAYMDNVGYLHASFQDSPVLRMPLTGKSVNEALGSFQESCIGVNSSSKRASARLRKCGELLGSRFPPGFLAHIDRYDQIVAITDIPVEWTICDGVPLGFLVDICRLPQSNPTSIMAQFASNAALGYSVKSNILEKTLVICGAAPDDPIGQLFDRFVATLKASGAAGPKAVRCLTKADFISTIEQHKPDLLIVDSHGNFESNEEGSYLSVGKEKIVGDDIPTIQHAMPLVILSCCLTAPLYGCSNTIAQAFFEAGSRSVVSTFLPISVDRGYLLYQRVLRNLASSVKEAYHRNWLSFISHNLRTSHFDDYLIPLRAALGEMEDFELFFKSRTPWMVDSMRPSKRREAYLATKEAVINSYRPALHERARTILNSQHFISEAFYYTHLGRADLVQFDIWLENEAAGDQKAKALYTDISASWCL